MGKCSQDKLQQAHFSVFLIGEWSPNSAEKNFEIQNWVADFLKVGEIGTKQIAK